MPTLKKTLAKKPAAKKKTVFKKPEHKCPSAVDLLAPKITELRGKAAKGDMKAKKTLAAFYTVLAEL